MFPLACTAFPTTPAELATALRASLAGHLTFPPGAKGVEAIGPSLDRLQQVLIDLSNAKVELKPPPPKPVVTGPRTPGVCADRLQVLARPLRVQDASAQFELVATGVKCDFARDQQGKPMLVLADAEHGRVESSVTRADLQAILLAGARIGAAQHGVTIQDLQIDLTPNGPRGVGINLRVKAKKMMMSGVVSVRGSAQIDDQLNARFSGLSCDGEGVVGKMAATMLSTKLREFEGKQIALSALSLGDLTLRDLQIDASNGLRITAEIGKR
jgi:hypothetical protein